MKKTKLQALILLMFLAQSSRLFSQAVEKEGYLLPTIFSASPNAASLGIYGQIPVSLFTGTPNININLYNLKVGNFEMPINASYHLSSVMPEERPGWIGLGWNLNVGGAITRTVRGGVDEVVIYNAPQPYSYGYYENYGTLNNVPNWDSTSNIEGIVNYCFNNTNNTHCAMPEPDEFNFNVNGLSGSFYKNHEGLWIVKANQNIDLKITSELKTDYKLKEQGNSSHNTKIRTIKRVIYGFTLTTDDGTIYVFGKAPNSIEFSASASPYTDGYRANYVAKTWYLTKIILPNNKEVNFTYQTGVNEEQYDPNADMTARPVFKQYLSTAVTRYYITNGNYTENNLVSNVDYQILERSFITYLSQISTESTEITFNMALANDLKNTFLGAPFSQYDSEYDDFYNPFGYYVNNQNWFKLNSFQVFDKTYSQVYKASFNFLDVPTSRLFLTGITEIGTSAGTQAKKHNFEYNQTPLPPYNSRKIDHYGYYNNKNFLDLPPANGLTYSDQQFASLYSTFRDPDPAYSQAGTLTKIIFPTGGFSEFTYEQNYFSKVVQQTPSAYVLGNAVSTSEIGCGLRIKKIVSDPLHGGIPIVKEYFYVKDYKNNDFTSSGVIAGRPEYIEQGSIPDFKLFRVTSNSFTNFNTTNGNYITYSKVVEKNADNSFTEYTYSNHDNGYIDKVPNKLLFYVSNVNFLNYINKKTPCNSVESERGNLLSEKKYNFQKQLVEESNNYYNDIPGRFTDKVRALYYDTTEYGEVHDCSGGGFSVICAVIFNVKKVSAYSIYSHHTFLKKTENIKYDLANASSTTKTIEYQYNTLDNHHHVYSTKSTTDVEVSETRQYYADDAVVQTEPYITNLKTKNMVGIPLKTETYKSNNKLSEKTTKYYPFPSVIAGSTMLLPQFIYEKKGNVAGEQPEKKVTYDYDTSGNIVQYNLENGAPVTVIWGHNKALPIAKIENATFVEVATALGITTTVLKTYTESNLSQINNLRNSMANAMITTYTYVPLIGITGITDPKGYRTSYEYDSLNRLKWVKDKDGNILSETQYNYKNQ